MSCYQPDSYTVIDAFIEAHINVIIRLYYLTSSLITMFIRFAS